jgi:RHS repeat-associated protein
MDTLYQDFTSPSEPPRADLTPPSPLVVPTYEILDVGSNFCFGRAVDNRNAWVFNVIDGVSHLFRYAPPNLNNADALREISGAEVIIAAQSGMSMSMLKPGTTNEYYLFTIGTDSLIRYHHIDMGTLDLDGDLGVVISANNLLDVNSTYLQSMELIEDHTATGTSVLYLRRLYQSVMDDTDQELVAITITEGGFYPPIVIDTFESRVSATMEYEMAINEFGTQLVLANNITSAGNIDTYELRLYDLGWDHIYTPEQDDFDQKVFSEEKSIYSVDFGKKNQNIIYSVKGIINGSGRTKKIAVDNLSANSPTNVLNEAYRIRTVARNFSGGNNINYSGKTTILTSLYGAYNGYIEYQNPHTGTSTIGRNLNLNSDEWALANTCRQPMRITRLNDEILVRNIGDKQYELTDHLGNVRFVFTDEKQTGVTSGDSKGNYDVAAVSVTDYYPFGMQMPGRNYSSDAYRYGFNGMEKDDEVKGSGNHMTTMWRQYDPRLGRFMTIDPKAKYLKSFSPYNFSLNSPIMLNDPNGDCPPGVNCPPESSSLTPGVEFLPSPGVSQLWDEGTELLNNAFFGNVGLAATVVGGKAKAQVGPIKLGVKAAVAEGSATVDNNGDVEIEGTFLSAGGEASFASANVDGEFGVGKGTVVVTDDDIESNLNWFYADGNATLGKNGMEWTTANAATVAIGGQIGPVKAEAGVNFGDIYLGIGKIIEGGTRYLIETTEKIVY